MQKIEDIIKRLENYRGNLMLAKNKNLPAYHIILASIMELEWILGEDLLRKLKMAEREKRKESKKQDG